MYCRKGSSIHITLILFIYLFIYTPLVGLNRNNWFDLFDLLYFLNIIIRLLKLRLVIIPRNLFTNTSYLYNAPLSEVVGLLGFMFLSFGDAGLLGFHISCSRWSVKVTSYLTTLLQPLYHQMVRRVSGWWFWKDITGRGFALCDGTIPVIARRNGVNHGNRWVRQRVVPAHHGSKKADVFKFATKVEATSKLHAPGRCH